MSDLPPPPEFEPGSSSQPPPPPDPSIQAPQTAKGWATLDTGQSVELAGPGRRLLARIVDMVIYFVFLIIVGIAAGGTGDDSTEVPLSPLLFIAVSLIYEVWMVAARGQTLGKMAVGIKVIRVDNGGPPGLNTSVSRWVLPGIFGAIGAFVQVFGLVSLLIYLSLLWGNNRQGWHDMLAKTLVAKA